MYITIMLITLNITVGWVVATGEYGDIAAGGGHYGGCGYIKTDRPLLIHICV